MRIPDTLRSLVESGRPAHMVTVNRDGSPQVSLVWVGLDGDEAVVGHFPRNQKVRNVERDPRVVLSIEAETTNPLGMTEYAVLYGSARIQQGGGRELLTRLAKVYLGPGADFPPMADPPPGYVTRINVTRIGGVGPWADGG